MMLVLGIETACDDCAASIVRDGTDILSNVVWGQKDVHERFGGVIPELAARRHTEVITRVIEAALNNAGVTVDALDAIAVNNQHGLLRSVVVGVTAAKGVSLATRKPLIGIHHIEGHIYSAILSDQSVEFPHICLAVAGGHNLLVLVKSIGDYQIIGRSLDDAAGEAFDKVAKELGLGFPGGPQIDKLAAEGNPVRFPLPRPLLNKPGYDFSFSGLKTAIRELLTKLGEEVSRSQADIAASFQRAVVDVLVGKTVKVASDLGISQITVVGGVAANSELRTRLSTELKSRGIRVAFARRDLCTDNAAMIAGVAYHYASAGQFSDMTLDAYPSAPLGQRKELYKRQSERLRS